MAEVKSIILGIDPGITTGWAVIDQDNKIQGTGNAQPDSVEKVLDSIIRLAHRNGYVVEAVVEEFPLQTAGKLAQDLRAVVSSVNRALAAYDIRVSVFRVLPGQWKTSAIGIAPIPEEVHDPSVRHTQHEKDAIRIARYHRSRGRKA